MKKVLIYLAHPRLRTSRINKFLFQQVSQLSNLSCVDLYETYPDFHIDVSAEQKRIQESDALVFQHPLYWYSSPALMKLWIDVVLEKGFAYGTGGDKLRGKLWWQVISTGSSDESYRRQGAHHFYIPELLRPFEQTAKLCQMRPLSPHVFTGSPHRSEDELREFANQYVNLVRQLQNGLEWEPWSSDEQEQFPRLSVESGRVHLLGPNGNSAGGRA